MGLYVPLTVANVWYFIFFEFKVCTCSFGKKNKTDQLFPFRKVTLFYDENVNWLN